MRRLLCVEHLGGLLKYLAIAALSLFSLGTTSADQRRDEGYSKLYEPISLPPTELQWELGDETASHSFEVWVDHAIPEAGYGWGMEFWFVPVSSGDDDEATFVNFELDQANGQRPRVEELLQMDDDQRYVLRLELDLYACRLVEESWCVYDIFQRADLRGGPQTTISFEAGLSLNFSSDRSEDAASIDGIAESVELRELSPDESP